jgi:hypothetical protein
MSAAPRKRRPLDAVFLLRHRTDEKNRWERAAASESRTLSGWMRHKLNRAARTKAER